MHLYIDIETRSSVDLKKSGLFKYVESPDFEIILLGYAIDKGKIAVTTDIGIIEQYLEDPEYLKLAHNSYFEITCLAKHFQPKNWIETARKWIKQWKCTLVMAYALGMPGKLEQVGTALGVKTKKPNQKLIDFFCKPNSKGVFYKPVDYPDKWDEFIDYNRFDVEGERRVHSLLSHAEVDWDMWHLDFIINTRGIKIDKPFVTKVIKQDTEIRQKAVSRMLDLTRLDNPNSNKQLAAWLTGEGLEINGMTKDQIIDYLTKDLPEHVNEVLKLKQILARTATKKYSAMLDMCMSDNRIRGMFAFIATHTGRWAGRGVQVHNLLKNQESVFELDLARQLVGHDELFILFPENILGQLTRTAFIGNYSIADFSAIEARVLAWLAGEEWVNKVFAGDGKIYEAQAARMFEVPIEHVTKNMRQRGKVATLALGYQGSVGALRMMNAEGTDQELEGLVKLWRNSNPNIVKLWWDVQKAITMCINTGSSTFYKDTLAFRREGPWLYICLPSGRKLAYYRMDVKDNRLHYFGRDTRMASAYRAVETYGGKLVENIVQAIARDILAESLMRLGPEAKIVMHVHDEIVLEDYDLKDLLKIMEAPIDWAPGLILRATGFMSNYYIK
jgi:DNA polymerase